MMDISAKSGALDVLASGVVVHPKNQLLQLRVEDLVANFTFKDEPEKVPLRWDWEIRDRELFITFVNFNSPLGASPTEPLALGSFRERKLYFEFYIVGSIASPSKVVNYTWLLGEAVR